jgi:hypothetical protein
MRATSAGTTEKKPTQLYHRGQGARGGFAVTLSGGGSTLTTVKVCNSPSSSRIENIFAR